MINTIEKITLRNIKSKDDEFEKENIPLTQRISNFKITLNYNNCGDQKNFEIHNKNMSRVKKWYLYKYNILDEQEFEIPIYMNKKGYFIKYINTNLYQFDIEINEDNDSYIIPATRFKLNWFFNLKKDGINKSKIEKSGEAWQNIKKKLQMSNLGANYYLKKMINNHNNNFFKISYEDYLSTVQNLKINNLKVAAWSAQQASEKILKAYLRNNNIKVNKTHDLIKLINDVKKNDSNFNVLDKTSLTEDELLKFSSPNIRYDIYEFSLEKTYEFAILYLIILAELQECESLINEK